MNAQPDYQLQRDAFGRLEFTDSDGQSHAGVVPVRAFPISATDEGIGIVDPHGRELAWIERLTDLSEAMRVLLESELAAREFIPEIRRIVSVSSFATPSTWEVDTDRGMTNLILKGEEDIRRLAEQALLINDSHGIRFLIRDRHTLDRASRRFLTRFL